MLLLLCVSVSRPDAAVIWQLTLTDLTGLPNKYTSCILREGVYNYLKWGFLRYFILELLIRHHVTQALYKRPHARVSLSLVTRGIHWVLYSCYSWHSLSIILLLLLLFIDYTLQRAYVALCISDSQLHLRSSCASVFVHTIIQS